MNKISNIVALPPQRIEQSIWLIRGQKVMLDADLARLYGVETKQLKRQVTRNKERFPEDFMFQLTNQELDSLRCQIGTSKGRGGSRYLPYVFTEQGVAMLSGLVNTPRAVEANIAIMRAFVKMRCFVQSQEIMQRDIDALKLQFDDHDEQIKAIFLMIDEIIAKPLPEPKKRPIGFGRDLETTE